MLRAFRGQTLAQQRAVGYGSRRRDSRSERARPMWPIIRPNDQDWLVSIDRYGDVAPSVFVFIVRLCDNTHSLGRRWDLQDPAYNMILPLLDNMVTLHAWLGTRMAWLPQEPVRASCFVGASHRTTSSTHACMHAHTCHAIAATRHQSKPTHIITRIIPALFACFLLVASFRARAIDHGNRDSER